MLLNDSTTAPFLNAGPWATKMACIEASIQGNNDEIRKTHRSVRDDAAGREAISSVQPRRRKLWVPGWDYENVMGTTELSENYVFLTKSHDHASTEAIWVVKSYEPESRRVQFYKIEPGDKVGIITVQCSEQDPGRTQVRVTYEYIAIAEKGDRFVESFDENAYADFIGEWETLLQKHFE